MIHLRPLTLVLLCALFSGCEKTAEPETSPDTPATTEVSAEELSPSTRHSWDTAADLLQQAELQTSTLQTAIAEFVATPSEESLRQARAQWQLTHNQLQQLSLLFALGDVSPTLFAPLRQAHFQLDAWPIEPGYLDYFDVYPHSGIVNDIVINIDEASIREQHGFTSDSDVSLGMHAISYLLWGENRQRPVSDYIPAEPTSLQTQSGIKPKHLPNQRRIALLQLQADLLAEDIKALGYQFSQPASGLNTAYARLAAAAQLELWQRSVVQVLDNLQKQLPTGEADDDVEQHSRFAGGQGQVLADTLKGVQQLLLSHDDNIQPLAHWLNPQGDLTVLTTQLQQTEATLREADKDWEGIDAEQIQTLNQQLRQLKAWFQPQGR
ncbi:imelysin family protein [Pseudomaricurvus sp.]|uniref:imelysin family protein n=1 Tax=Pseudomaricurvus sp. TaxID=2004510 RepID=UPI003F6B39EA